MLFCGINGAKGAHFKTVLFNNQKMYKQVSTENSGQPKADAFANWCDKNNRICIISYKMDEDTLFYTISVKLFGTTHTAYSTESTIELATEGAVEEYVRYMNDEREIVHKDAEDILNGRYK